jgi:tRNA pseudouridine38-40 synthase
LPTFKITLAYDGTAFVGWQRQDTGTSVQGLLEDALGRLDGRQVAVIGAGRTDSGVHALGQVAHVSLARSIDGRSLAAAVNTRLPPSVRVLEATAVGDEFHARFHARRKIYRYRIWNTEVASPFERLYSWHLPAPMLDVASMDAAARSLEGRHDFAAFQAAGSDARGTDRSLFVSRVAGDRPPLVTYDVAGDGFLRHMVRNLVGTLVEVGRGKRPAAWVADVLASRDRVQAGPTAPPEGLFLVRVEYDEPGGPRPETSG